MDNNHNVESILKLNRIYFENINYTRKLTDNKQVKYTYNFEREISKINEDNYIVSLKSVFNDIDERYINLSIKIVGYFECESKDDALKKKLISQNTIAILFPYLRSQVTLVTAQPDMTPINIPPLNITAMFSEDYENN